MMAPHSLKFAVILILMSSLPFLPSESVGLQWSSLKQSKMVIGSRPPGCVNKCMSCRPCMATLVVIHPHDHNKNKSDFTKISDSISRREDDPYYLLSWKCKCGNRLYQP